MNKLSLNYVNIFDILYEQIIPVNYGSISVRLMFLYN